MGQEINGTDMKNLYLLGFLFISLIICIDAIASCGLENFAPPLLQEPYDNAKLITGQKKWECNGALIVLDSTEAIID